MTDFRPRANALMSTAVFYPDQSDALKRTRKTDCRELRTEIYGLQYAFHDNDDDMRFSKVFTKMSIFTMR